MAKLFLFRLSKNTFEKSSDLKNVIPKLEGSGKSFKNEKFK